MSRFPHPPAQPALDNETISLESGQVGTNRVIGEVQRPRQVLNRRVAIAQQCHHPSSGAGKESVDPSELAAQAPPLSLLTYTSPAV